MYIKYDLINKSYAFYILIIIYFYISNKLVILHYILNFNNNTYSRNLLSYLRKGLCLLKAVVDGDANSLNY